MGFQYSLALSYILMVSALAGVLVGVADTAYVSTMGYDIYINGIVERIEQMNASMIQDYGVVRPRIAVLALNPHAGDGGLLGSEEAEIIKPAIVEAFKKEVLAFGPFAADGFFASGQFKNYDAILAMYHDQGLTPFKTLTPDGVNFSASLDAVRTSPDHGVAYDIAGKGCASEDSFRNAIYAAIDIARNRERYDEANAFPLKKQYYEKRDDSDKLRLDQVDDEA